MRPNIVLQNRSINALTLFQKPRLRPLRMHENIGIQGHFMQNSDTDEILTEFRIQMYETRKCRFFSNLIIPENVAFWSTERHRRA